MNLPAIDYAPPVPKNKNIGIGIIGCGGIARTQHIPAYKAQGFRIVAVADIVEENARQAAVLAGGVPFFTDHHRLLALEEVHVVDAATHPAPRAQLIRDALRAGKHVLSQKPFVLNLAVGRQLIALARKNKVLLAVNQNGRWAPPWKAAFELIRKGVIGKVLAAHLRSHWDHNWVAGTPFDALRHCILYDFAIHYFDILCCWMDGQRPLSVYATDDFAPNQRARARMMAQAVVRYKNAQASLVFDASCKVGAPGGFTILGTKGSIQGNEWNHLELHLPGGTYRPRLSGNWFPDGFKGTMGALLCAIEQRRPPWNSAENNLRSLQLCFAACMSADRGKPVVVSTAQKLPPGNITT